MDIQLCLNEYIKELESEVMKILSDPKTDKRTKNLAMKPLTSKKKIIKNTIEALELVDKVHKEEMEKVKGEY
ncbi:hypothetical protein RZR97_07545 [Hydrogenimonas thermophila]|uniref:hypothetical protein n=1 Tax=Hydrogenimonas thermophila TaxID=223786 RepID=UPI002936DC64|nr:hypothetical protein [Hydrogenimonas thermophila]WOE68970.1 hypothetical protein RZR91_07580 [Hydrogenimonas thermophila]WOE71477.1 hypothetical protein RZR97_07545 [Hydrogenimonas thermophila]